MPIPQSDLQKQVKTPNVATGQALDASDMIKQAMAPAFNTINKLNSLGNQMQRFEVAQQRADSQQQAQDAMNAYLAGREQLDTQLHQKTLNDAVAFRDKYYQEADVMHQKFLSQIAAIKDADVRENARQRINAYNMNAASKTEAYVFGQDDKAKDMSLEASNQNSANIAATSVSPVLTNDANIVAFNAAVADGTNDIVNRYTQKGAPAEVTTLAVQEFQYKAAEQAAQTLAADSSNGYGSVLNFIYGLGASNSLQHDDVVKLARKYEDQQLNYKFAKNEEAFRKNDGTYNEELAKQIAPNLTPLERYNKLKLLSAARAGNGALSAGQYGAISETDRAFKDYLITDMANKGLAGLLDKNDIVDFLGVAPDDKSLDTFKASQQKLREDYTRYNPTAIMDLMSMLKAGNNTQIIWNQGNGKWKATASRAELQQAAINGYHILNKPTMQDNDQLYTRLSAELRNMVQGEGWDNAIKNKYLSGVAPSSKEVTDYIAAGMLNRMYDNRGWFTRFKNWVQGKSVDTQPFTSYVGTMEKVRIAAQETLKRNGLNSSTPFDKLENGLKQEVLTSMAMAAATSLPDSQLDRIGLQVSREGGDIKILNNSQRALEDFLDVKPEYDLFKARTWAMAGANPNLLAYYYAKDTLTAASYYMNKYARLSKEAADERLAGLQERIKQERRTAQPKAAVIRAGESNVPNIYSVDNNTPSIKMKRNKSQYNLLTGQQGYYYEDYTDTY